MEGKIKIAFFGHFGAGNFGNEATLQAMLCRLRGVAPNAEFCCICLDPSVVSRTYDIAAVPSRALAVKRRTLHNPLARLARKFVVGAPTELSRWLRSLGMLRGTDALIVPGTGLLTDAYILRNWGPYDMFRWSVAARLCGCKVLFVSVGAGPLYSRAGRFFVKAGLSLADYRTYRDESSLHYLHGIGFRARGDAVYPDLAFSLPKSVIPHSRDTAGSRPVVGLGVMLYAGKYSVERPTGAVYLKYLETLAEFVTWLLAHEYDVRLLIGDLVDEDVALELTSLLRERSVYDERRIFHEPTVSVDDLLTQLAATDVVVATRFHNVLLALLLDKPVIAISFHHKCASLMSQMGLSEYCQDINRLDSDKLIEQFMQIQQDADYVKRMIADKVGAFRDALDEQYALIFAKISSGQPGQSAK